MPYLLDRTGLIAALKKKHDAVKYQSPDDEGAMEYQGHIQDVIEKIQTGTLTTIEEISYVVSDVGVSIEPFLKGRE